MGYFERDFGCKIIRDVPDDVCPECGVKHDPEMPHNRNSAFYLFVFYDDNGRWPTWADAMAHCSDEVKEFWTAALEEKGISVNKDWFDKM